MAALTRAHLQFTTFQHLYRLPEYIELCFAIKAMELDDHEYGVLFVFFVLHSDNKLLTMEDKHATNNLNMNLMTKHDLIVRQTGIFTLIFVHTAR